MQRQFQSQPQQGSRSALAFRPTPIRKGWKMARNTSVSTPPAFSHSSPQTVRFAGEANFSTPGSATEMQSKSYGDVNSVNGMKSVGKIDDHDASYRSSTPLTVSTAGTRTPPPSKSTTGMTSLQRALANGSPCGFIPISEPDDFGRLSAPSTLPLSPSPFEFRKAVSPSPSTMCIFTDDNNTVASGMDMSFRSSCSRTNSPACFSPISGTSSFLPAGNSRNSSPFTTPRPRTPSSTSGTNNNGRKSPFQTAATAVAAAAASAAAEDDTVRKTRIKTEMCMHYTNGTPCPFGAKCTYAHGEEELQMTKLLDLEQAGLIDLETYRTKPCLTWVMTGSCPFGKRCECIHDPRVAGSNPSWLTHTETQGNTMDTDINVEASHQRRLNEVFYGTPFGQAFSLEDNQSFADLYKLVCNTGNIAKDQVRGGAGWIESPSTHHYKTRNSGTIHCNNNHGNHHYGRNGYNHQPNAFRAAPLHAIYKLQIALHMRAGENGANDETHHNWQYKYRPQHIIFEEICMVLQERAFRLVDSTMSVMEIPVSRYNPQAEDNVLVREISFGPDCEPTARGVALYFNIDEKEVTQCTPQQAKRFRFKRSVNKKGSGQENSPVKVSVFDSLDCFNMIRPRDKDAYDLVGEMMLHRVNVLHKERITNMRERFDALKEMEAQKKHLQKRFGELRASWVTWAWPVNVGRERVTKNTPVPAIDGKYELKENNPCPRMTSTRDAFDHHNEENKSDHNLAKLGSGTHNLWKSMIDTNFEKLEDPKTCFQLVSPTSKVNKSGMRLPIFEKLAGGTPVTPEYMPLPHILQDMKDNDKKQKGSSLLSACAQESLSFSSQERCWRSLLLFPQVDGGINEWDMIRDHFEKSRSKKVLKIIQQPAN